MDDWIALTGSSDTSFEFPDDPGLGTFLWHVFRSRQGCDVHFVLRTGRNRPEVIVAAHRLVLALWSPKFADMFYNSGEKRNHLERVTLEDVEPEGFEAMMGFLYGVDPPFDSVKGATELFDLAVRFEVRALADLCLGRLSDVQVGVTNVFEVLESARRTGDADQWRRCMDIVQDQTRGLLTLYECCDFSPSMVHTVLDCPRLAVKCEYELFNWLFAWARIRFKGCSEYGSVREVLAEFLPKLNFLDLTDSQFASLCSQQEGVFEEREALSIFMNIGVRGSMALPDWCQARDRAYIA